MKMTNQETLSSQKHRIEKKLKYNNFIQLNRLRWDMTQESLAKHLGVSRQTIIALEKGKKQPSLYMAIKNAKFFHRPVEEIFRYRI